MLDTDICIYVIKNRPVELRNIFNEHVEQLCISCVTFAELLFGAEKSSRLDRNLETVEGFAARLSVLPFEDTAAAHYGEIRAALERAGTPIGPYDLMIAGHARSEGLILVTNNEREFSRVDGLRVENWSR
jgi:tRNA(fMet)-specific endonuclease VapC